MSSTAKEPVSVVPPEEVARRIAEWRRISLERKGPAIMIYSGEHRGCPWPGCPTIIAGAAFHLDRQQDASAKMDGWLEAWWSGPGLIGRCPGCENFVRYGYFDKQRVDNVSPDSDALLPDDWFRTAQIAPPLSK